MFEKLALHLLRLDLTTAISCTTDDTFLLS